MALATEWLWLHKKTLQETFSLAITLQTLTALVSLGLAVTWTTACGASGRQLPGVTSCIILTPIWFAQTSYMKMCFFFLFFLNIPHYFHWQKTRYHENQEIVAHTDEWLENCRCLTVFHKAFLTRECWSRLYPSGSSRRTLYPCRNNKCSAWFWTLPLLLQTPCWTLGALRGWPRITPRHRRHLVLYKTHVRNKRSKVTDTITKK